MAPLRFFTASTASRPLGERFAYWQSLHPRADLTLTDDGLAAAYHGEMLTCIAPDGTAFCQYESDPVIVRFGRQGADSIMLGVLWSGALRIRHGRENSRLVGPGSGLFVIDAGKPVTLQSLKRTSLSYFAIPRGRAITAVDADLSYLDPGIVAMGIAGVPGFLVATMRRIRREAENLDAMAAAAVMDAARSLCLGCLRQLVSERVGHKRPPDALVAQAKAYIERHGGERMLTAASIAAALGCSRAHLYRAFADVEESVGAYLRAARLDRARTLLRVRKLSIDQIAIASGYGSATAFTRAFRVRFGVTPAKWRTEQAQG